MVDSAQAARAKQGRIESVSPPEEGAMVTTEPTPKQRKADMKLVQCTAVYQAEVATIALSHIANPRIPG